jgi:hypothetical protein
MEEEKSIFGLNGALLSTVVASIFGIFTHLMEAREPSAHS